MMNAENRKGEEGGPSSVSILWPANVASAVERIRLLCSATSQRLQSALDDIGPGTSAVELLSELEMAQGGYLAIEEVLSAFQKTYPLRSYIVQEKR